MKKSLEIFDKKVEEQEEQAENEPLILTERNKRRGIEYQDLNS